MKTTRVPSNLLRIRQLKDNDLLVTPHLPEYGKLIINVVDGNWPDCYEYVSNDRSHQNHRIRVKRSYGLDGNIDIRAGEICEWYGKLQWLRLPVLPIPEYEGGFNTLIQSLEAEPGKKFSPSRLDEYLDKLSQALLDCAKDKLRLLKPSGTELSFEEVCGWLLKKAGGYRIEKTNQHRDGGDVDLQCARNRTDVSPFEAGRVNLFVQVKKHTGKTDKPAVEQVLKMMQQDPSADGCVMSLAEDFTPEARKLADENDVLLMDGNALCKLLMRWLSEQ
jgi:hypothetical protein